MSTVLVFVIYVALIAVLNAFVLPGRTWLSVSPNRLQGLSRSTLRSKIARQLLSVEPLRYEDEDEDDDNISSVDESFTLSEPDISVIKEDIKHVGDINGSDVRIGIIMARWNADIVQSLYKGVNESLALSGVKPSNIFTTYVPGSFELPVTAKLLAASKRVDVIITLGCLVKGETMHFEYIAGAVANGLMQVSLDTMVPCIFGVLTVLNKPQAIAHSTGPGNEGLSWGRGAVEMGLHRMAALGMDKKPTQQQGADGLNPFVTFRAPLPAVGPAGGGGGDGKNVTTKPVERRVGF